ncbi:LysR family transcriptional regulator [Sphingomonas sp. TX0543]|uniref:LysR family transcriptional regulator n=1 Tax=unclassified Sphingomonas TaxID=196159 RepID=UPI0010F60D4E|nr:LysR family transcriptional regulator [Sphingomonas sp. 3P27F8]
MTDPFDLNLRHLRAIPLIAERGSMSAAAEGVSLSQPALTQGLAKVERQLGVALFERHPDGMTTTEEGRVFVARIDAAFAQLAQATRGGGRGGRGFARPERLMTATQLRAFLTLADAGSFVEGARATGWSQPALHRAVRELEQLVAVPLLERRGRGVALTAQGRRLARGVRLAAAEVAAAIAETGTGAGDGTPLVIGAMPLSRARVLPNAIAALIDAAPRATVKVVEGSWRELVEPLRDGVIDLMIGAVREDTPAGLKQVALFEDRLAVIARREHPLAAAPDPTPAMLAAYPWIVGSRQTPLRAQWQALFPEAAPAAPIECGSVMTIRGILLHSDCLTLLSPDQVALEIQAGLLTVIGRPRADMVRTIGITTRDPWRPTALQSRFLELLGSA